MRSAKNIHVDLQRHKKNRINEEKNKPQNDAPFVAFYEQFLLFSCVFKRLVLQTRKIQGLLGKGLSMNRIPVNNNDFFFAAKQ